MADADAIPQPALRRATVFGALGLLLVVQLVVRACVQSSAAPLCDVELDTIGQARAARHPSDFPAGLSAGPPALRALIWGPVLSLGGAARLEVASTPEPRDAVELGTRVASAAERAGLLAGITRHARLITLACGVAMLLLLSRTTSLRASPTAALVALALTALDVNLIRNFALATTVAPLALLLLLALLCFARYLARRSLRWCALASALLALAALLRLEILAILPALLLLVGYALARAKLPDCMDLPLPRAMRIRLGLKHMSRYAAIQLAALAAGALLFSPTHPLAPFTLRHLPNPPMTLWTYLPALLLAFVALRSWRRQRLYLHGHHLLTLAFILPLALTTSLPPLLAITPLAYATIADFATANL
jgi:hypothetical protein